MILMKLEKFLEFFWKEMLYLHFKITMKPYFHLCLTFLSRQLDNDDVNDDENDIDKQTKNILNTTKKTICTQ